MKAWSWAGLLLATFFAFAQQPEAEEGESAVPDQIVIQTKAGARFLKKPKEGARQHKELAEGITLTATDARGLFLKVRHEQKTGWIHVSQLRFDQHGPAFVKAKNQEKKGYASRRHKMSGGKADGKADLQQCAHVDHSGKRCLYQTADASGYCPEHQH